MSASRSTVLSENLCEHYARRLCQYLLKILYPRSIKFIHKKLFDETQFYIIIPTVLFKSIPHICKEGVKTLLDRQCLQHNCSSSYGNRKKSHAARSGENAGQHLSFLRNMMLLKKFLRSDI